MRKVIVTGGAGFIGAWLVRELLRSDDTFVVNVDKLTYAADGSGIKEHENNANHIFIKADICDRGDMDAVIRHYQPDAIMHLAAESHVDRSIDGADDFIQTNIVGTFRLLEAARHYWAALPMGQRESFRFHHISTDEVFGSLGPTGKFQETTPYQPNSPYSASKAASDHLVRAWHATHGLPVIVTNCSNNYGPYQFPEKLIPLTIVRAFLGQTLPVYGKGDNVRDWLYVEDHARALIQACFEGKPGETYNVGGNHESTNLEIVHAICAIVDELAPDNNGVRRSSRIEFVTDRPGHDHRYAIDTSKIHRELGWSPKESFVSGLRKTVEWYIDNTAWWEHIRSRRYSGARLGVVTPPALMKAGAA